MKGMARYTDKAAKPQSRLKYYFNDLIILCIYNGTGLVCSGLIKRLQCATVTGHLLNIKSQGCTCTETRTYCKYNHQPDTETLNNNV